MNVTREVRAARGVGLRVLDARNLEFGIHAVDRQEQQGLGARVTRRHRHRELRELVGRGELALFERGVELGEAAPRLSQQTQGQRPAIATGLAVALSEVAAAHHLIEALETFVQRAGGRSEARGPRLDQRAHRPHGVVRCAAARRAPAREASVRRPQPQQARHRPRRALLEQRGVALGGAQLRVQAHPRGDGQEP